MREFNIGDRVFSEKYGEGIVIDTNLSETDYPIKVNFGGDYVVYTLDGKYWSTRYSYVSEKDKDIEHIEKDMKHTTQAEVFIEFARVARLIEGTELKLIDVFKYDNEKPLHEYAYKDKMLGDYDKYTFALALVEDKPVFVGDTLYHTNGSALVVQAVEEFSEGRLAFKSIREPFVNGDWVKYYSWKQPKKTFILNGIELPLPTNDNSTTEFALYKEVLSKYTWNTSRDRDTVLKAIINLLEGVV